jgi:UDP-N-acetylglucosamine--N-acetylmuramyl-(pentapeptide) pyrophosphoryl-undecaprenol N-acetylglucosamine transferase
MKYLISGGGTGGHIFPAVSIANALREADPTCEILFVGALGRMEMERVPQAGYKIVGLPVKGFDRSRPWKNIRVVIDLVCSMLQARKIVRDFRPDVGVGVGGYASGAAMKVAAKMGVPILLQEQNGFAGVTNKLLKDDAKKICVAYEGMERFFPKDKIILTGNPVRQNLTTGTKEEAIRYFNEEFGVNFSPDKKTLLIIGGSLGARTINQSIIAHLPELLESDIQIVWQTGKNYFADCEAAVKTILHNTTQPLHNTMLCCTAFLSHMPLAYALADLVISRAGASSISELCLLGKPSILVPSPNVAEDHQTHNAMALVKKDAAVLVKDVDAQKDLISTALSLIQDDKQLDVLHGNILQLALPDSARLIAEEVMNLAKK